MAESRIIISDDLTCPITLSKITDLAIANPCGHHFEKDAILDWTKIHNTCPCCRKEIEKLKLPEIVAKSQKADVLEKEIEEKKYVPISSGGFFASPQLIPEQNPLPDNEILDICMNGGFSELLSKLYLDSKTTHLITKKSRGIEIHNHRSWSAVSPLIFCAFAGDVTDDYDYAKGKLNLLLHKLPTEDRSEALQQLREVRDLGTEHGACLTPFRDLVQGYQVLENNCPVYDYPFEKKSAKWNDDDCAAYWATTIGKAQKQLPLMGLKYYGDYSCFRGPFPKFSPFSSRPRDDLLYIEEIDIAFRPQTKRLSFNKGTTLGVSAALYKQTPRDQFSSSIKQPAILSRWHRGSSLSSREMLLGATLFNVKTDAHAMEYLCEEKLADLDKTIKNLEEELGVESFSKKKC